MIDMFHLAGLGSIQTERDKWVGIDKIYVSIPHRFDSNVVNPHNLFGERMFQSLTGSIQTQVVY